MIIDFEHHYFPEELVRKHGAKPGERYTWVDRGIPRVNLHDGLFNMEEHLYHMDAAGIDVAVLSAWDLSLEECCIVNDNLAKVQGKYSGRFIGLASTQLLRGKEALEELDRAIKGLGLKGVVICATVDGKPIDSPELYPFYEKVTELDVPIYVHPSTFFVGFDFLNAPYDLHRGIGREFDLCTATVRLIMGGVLEDFPTLNVVISHLGGGIAALLERIQMVERRGPAPSTKMKKPFGEYFGRLYFDMAGYQGGMNAVDCAMKVIKPARLVFGTDYPQNFYEPLGSPEGIKEYIENIRKLEITEESKELILGGNASSILHL